MSVVSKRYARAALEAVWEADGSEGAAQLCKGLTAFVQAYAVSAELREVLGHPTLRVEREGVLDAVCVSLGVSASCVRLVRVLMQAGRVCEVADVLRDLEVLVDEREGRMQAEVVSAVVLTDAQQQRIAQALTRRVGRPVVLRVTVDPSIVAGLVCRVGDVTLDTSLKRQYQVLRERLGADGAH